MSKNIERSVSLSEEDWKQKLSPQEFHVLREKGTERPFTGEYWDHHGVGDYYCAGCGELLFSSVHKFDSGCGWPSFFETLDKSKIEYIQDTSFGMIRTEVVCMNCGGHLGHVFDDGPKPTRQRYCINSVSLKFVPENQPE